MVRKDELDRAYDELVIAKVFLKLCYATWGNEKLSKRCVKVNKNTPNDVKKLETRMSRAVKEHFKFILYLRKYPYLTYMLEVSQMNTYFNRAISHSKKVMNRIQNTRAENSEIDSDSETEM